MKIELHGSKLLSRLQRFSVESLFNGGYKKLDLKGDGINTNVPACVEMDKIRKDWSIGGGFSIKF